MRWTLGLVLVLLAVPLAGCAAPRGTLEIELFVEEQGALNQFRSVNLTLRDVQIQAKTLSPEKYPSAVTRIELVSAARAGKDFQVFKQDVRSDNYQRLALITPPGSTFEGILNDGTAVAVVVPNGMLVQTTNFDVPRGGEVRFQFSIQLKKTDVGVGSPTYSIIPVPEESGPR